MPTTNNKTEKPELTQRDLDTVFAELPVESKLLPTEKMLRLIWKRCIPPNATIQDFIFFEYNCLQRGLDPLLSEAYLRLQQDRQTGVVQPIIIVGINGALKLVNSSGLLDGIRVTFAEDEAGGIVSATCLVFKKHAAHPFESTVYFREYCPLKDGKPTYMWATKGHMMLQKCVIMAGLRLAFADILGGVYVAEEFAQREPAEANFVVESTDDSPPEPKKSESQTLAPEPPIQVAPVEQSVKQKLLAMKERIMTDLSIPRPDRKRVLDQYFRGYLGINEPLKLPTDPETYLMPLKMLDHMALLDATIGRRLTDDPFGTGVGAASLHATWFSKWPFEVSALAHRVAVRFELDRDELGQYLAANGINPSREHDVSAFLRLALIDRDLAADVTARTMPCDMQALVVTAETSLGGPLENFNANAVRGAMLPDDTAEPPGGWGSR